MNMERHTDERGEFVAVTCADGRAFTIDLADQDILAGYRWYVMPSRPARCEYVCRGRAGGGTLLLHREIMQAPKGLTVDHRDGIGLNDRRYNLRLCTYGQNRFNSHHPKWTASGYRGVYLRRGRYEAIISLSGRRKYLGTFDDPIEAARAFDAAAWAHRGEFTQLNFPRTDAAEGLGAL